MFKAVIRRLPVWMDPAFPVTATIIRRADPRQRWLWRLLSAGLGWLILVGMLTSSVALNRSGIYHELFEPGEFVSFTTLYFPVLALQVLGLLGAFSQVAAIGLTPPGAPFDAQRDTWELAKVTSRGSELVTRARWVALLYRMRGMIALLVIVRLGFSVQVVVDLALSWDEFRAVVVAALPGLAPGVAAALVIALLLGQAALLVTMAGTLAALGLLLVTACRPRWAGGLAQQVAFVVMLVVFCTAMFTGWNALFGARTWGVYRLLDSGRGVLALVLLGDQGWRLTSLDALVALIANVKYGVWLAVPVWAAAALEIGLIRWLLRAAARFAGLPERT